MPRQYWQLGLLNDRVLKVETIGPPFDLVYLGCKGVRLSKPQLEVLAARQIC